MSTASLTVRATNLDHRHALRAEVAGQPGPISAGALDTDPIDRAEAGKPGVQLGEPGRRRRERLDTEHTAIGIDRGGDMNVEMGVYPAGDLTCLYDGHRHPFFSSTWLRGGTHVPGRRP